MVIELGEACHFFSGTGFPTIYQGKTCGDLPFYKVGDISKNVMAGNVYLSVCDNYISTAEAKEIKGTILPPNVIVFAKIGEALKLNRRAITSCNCLIDNNTMGILPKQNILRIKYFYYFMKQLKLQELAESTTVPSVRRSKLEQVKITVPSTGEQEKIENILDAISSVIIIRQKELQKLDNLVKARFVEMFGNLSTNDKNWREISLFDACNKLKRYPTFCNMEYLAQGVRVIRISNILTDGHMDIDDDNYVFVYDGANVAFPDTVIELQDIVMAVRGDGSAAKRIGIIQEEKLVGANISPNLIRIQAKSEIMEPMWLFYYLTSEVGQKRLDAYVNKTAKKNIAAKDIAKIVTPVPDLNKQKQYVEFVNQVNKSKLLWPKVSTIYRLNTS